MFKTTRITPGFWRKTPTSKRDSHLPYPIADSCNLTKSQQADFLSKLRVLQNTRGTYLHGMSCGGHTCRICGKGSYCGSYFAEFNGKCHSWQEGFVHYVEEHNVSIPQDFFDFITSFNEKSILLNLNKHDLRAHLRWKENSCWEVINS